MIAELISVGTELLLGNIVNTNAAYLAEQCAGLGLTMFYQNVVGDNEERMYQMIKTAVDRSDVVILSGGLGPTQDDITKGVAARVMGKELVEDLHTRRRIEHYFEVVKISRPGIQVTENNWRQAMIPLGAIVLDNANGTAPGLIIEENGKSIILLPGPPGELKPMFKHQVHPYLEQKQPELICSRMVKICGIGESQAETMVKDLIEAQSNPTLAPYAKTGEVHLRITAKADSKEAAQKLIEPVLHEVKERFGQHIFATHEERTLEESIIFLMKKQSLSLTTVESCTGGALAARIVNVPGVSDIYRQGFITYSNEAKETYLSVQPDTLRQYGAVSAQTASEMALGGAANTKADVCVSITGIAGPGGGTAEKPVGLVYIGCSVNGLIKVQEYHFNGNRSRIREQAVVNALTLLRGCILEHIYKQ